MRQLLNFRVGHSETTYANEAIKRGIKVWVFGDSHNGYFQKFWIYFRKEGT